MCRPPSLALINAVADCVILHMIVINHCEVWTCETTIGARDVNFVSINSIVDWRRRSSPWSGRNEIGLRGGDHSFAIFIKVKLGDDVAPVMPISINISLSTELPFPDERVVFSGKNPWRPHKHTCQGKTYQSTNAAHLTSSNWIIVIEAIFFIIPAKGGIQIPPRRRRSRGRHVTKKKHRPGVIPRSSQGRNPWCMVQRHDGYRRSPVREEMFQFCVLL